MATRMQQRRGTAAQWTSANPILAAGEIGFETDTSKFRIGDGVNHWEDLTYYASAAEIAALIDGAPDLLNTLNELAAAIGDDANFATTIQNAVDLAEDNANTFSTGAVNTHNQATTNVHGIADTADLALYSDISNAVDAHAGETTNVHGITNTADLAVTSYVDQKATDAENNAISAAGTALSSHESDTTGVHGIADTADLATKTYADTAASDAAATAKTGAEDTAAAALSAHALDTTSVHGISDTANLVYTSDLSGHASDTTNIHGIVDTAELALLSDVALKQDKVTGVSDTEIGYLDGVTSKIQDQLDGKSASGHGHGLTEIDGLFTALGAKADLSGATFTGDVTVETNFTVDGNLTVSGTTTTVSAQDLVVSDPLIYIGEGNTANLVDLGVVSSFNDGTYQHSGIVRDSSAGKWKVFKGVTDEPTTTVNFAQGSLDDLAVNNVEVAGVVFTDGTQSKEGVPSRTPIIAKTASYTLSALTERDSLVEVASSSATTITIPADSAVNFPIGTSIDVLQTSTGQVTIAGAGGVTVNATPGLKLRTTWSSATLFKRAANTWVVYGDLMA